jgi:hypothetical protein
VPGGRLTGGSSLAFRRGGHDSVIAARILPVGAVERDAEQAEAEDEAHATPALQHGGAGGIVERNACEDDPAHQANQTYHDDQRIPLETKSTRLGIISFRAYASQKERTQYGLGQFPRLDRVGVF